MAKSEASGGAEKGAGKKNKKVFKKRGEKRVVHSGLAHIQASFNNTIVTITDTEGNVIAWSSAGGIGFKGSRKGTPFAATQAAINAANTAKQVGLRSVDVRVTGPGSGRESAIRALQTLGIEVKSIRDVTPIPHNGCRPAKATTGLEKFGVRNSEFGISPEFGLRSAELRLQFRIDRRTAAGRSGDPGAAAHRQPPDLTSERQRQRTTWLVTVVPSAGCAAARA